MGALVFHAGTALHGDRLVTNGGRILGVTGLERDDRGRTRCGIRGRGPHRVRRACVTVRTSRSPQRPACTFGIGAKSGA